MHVDAAKAIAATYDVVIIGSGVSGSILANELARNGHRVLIMEAGPGTDLTIAEYETNVQRFYSAVSKDNNSPYAKNANAPMPRSYETQKLRPGAPDTSGYFVQKGPWEIDSTYTRVLGGTTRHWEGKALRMLPDDFQLRSRYGCGRDWPISYDELEPYYRRAELELGVAGDVEDQDYGGLNWGDGYVLPMHRMPPSYLDQLIAKDVDGLPVTLGDEEFKLRIRTTPQARNGVPNAKYDGGKGMRPDGAVSFHQADMGERCQGNTNCVPICPVQAKYDARRTLYRALQTGRVDLLAQAVASKVVVDGSGRVTGIEFKAYADPDSREHTSGTVRAKIFILAANAVENARLMLASGLHSTSGQMGRNLMDHAYLLTWALTPEVAGAYRGPLCTSGIEELRTGSFRQRQAAFRAGIHNDGWGWATASPYTDIDLLIDLQNKFGHELRRALVSRLSRQVLIDYMVEILPDENNRITVDPQYVDQMGNPRPVIAFGIPDYTMEGVAFARQVARRIYQRMGAEEHTNFDPSAVGYVSYQGESYVIRGGNHWAGTHLMGTSAKNSVVDGRQRAWDHENLYLAGAGSMPTIGTANTTLTLAALCFRTAEQITNELKARA